MTVISDPQSFNEDDLYVDLRPIFGHSLFLKCEGFNFAGSIKLKAATEMVEAAERDGTADARIRCWSSPRPETWAWRSSMIAASKGYGFLCVTDSRCNLSTRRLMEALGSQVHVIAEPDPHGGLLGARIDYVRALCASDDRYVWLNQYTNPGNWRAHYRTTAPAIARQFPELDVLFVGAGTTGTLMGCARYFREWHRPVRVVAVDSVGSVTFGGPPGRRMIPGLGAERPPAAARRVLRGRGRHRGGGGHHPGLPPPGQAAGSCSADPPARWSAARWAGWPQHDGRRSHRGGHRPRPRRALPRHRLPDQLAGGSLRRGPARPSGADPRPPISLNPRTVVDRVRACGVLQPQPGKRGHPGYRAEGPQRPHAQRCTTRFLCVCRPIRSRSARSAASRTSSPN